MYTAQRWTGGIAFFYIVWHTWHLRFTGVDLLTYPGAVFRQGAGRIVQYPGLLAFYVVGLICASWHFAYGIWLFAAKWGITTGEAARKRLLATFASRIALLFIERVGWPRLYSFRSTIPLQQPRTDRTTRRADS